MAENLEELRSRMHTHFQKLLMNLQVQSDQLEQEKSNEFYQTSKSLMATIQEFRDVSAKVPGIGTSKDDQLAELNALRSQLEEKDKLLKKYQGNPIFEKVAEAMDIDK